MIPAGALASQVGVLADFYEPFRPQNRQPPIAPGIQPVGREPVHADIACAAVAAQHHIAEILEFGMLRVIHVAVLRHAQTAMRESIRAVTDGVYRHGFDIDGFDSTLRVEARLTIAVDALEMDYAGTSPQVARGINS